MAGCVTSPTRGDVWLPPAVRPAAAGGRAVGDHNRIYRLDREQGLTVRKRRAHRKAVGTRAPMDAKPNARWSLDFIHDQFANGRRFRILATNAARLR